MRLAVQQPAEMFHQPVPSYSSSPGMRLPVLNSPLKNEHPPLLQPPRHPLPTPKKTGISQVSNSQAAGVLTRTASFTVSKCCTAHHSRPCTPSSSCPEDIHPQSGCAFHDGACIASPTALFRVRLGGPAVVAWQGGLAAPWE